MILGRVNDNREAIVQLALRGNENQLRLVRSVVDTGYAGYLMLPQLYDYRVGVAVYRNSKGCVGGWQCEEF